MFRFQKDFGRPHCFLSPEYLNFLGPPKHWLHNSVSYQSLFCILLSLFHSLILMEFYFHVIIHEMFTIHVTHVFCTYLTDWNLTPDVRKIVLKKKNKRSMHFCRCLVAVVRFELFFPEMKKLRKKGFKLHCKSHQDNFKAKNNALITLRVRVRKKN